MKRQVTAKLERFLRAADGVKFSVSFTRDGQSWIILKFKPGMDSAAAERSVGAQLARVRPELPPTIGEPAVAAMAPEVKPIALLAFSSDTQSPVDVSVYIDQRVRSAFNTVPGLYEVRVYGHHQEIIEIHLDPRRLSAHRVSLGDVEAALKANNVMIGSPRKLDGAIVLPIVDRFTVTHEALLRVVVRTDSAGPIHLANVGRMTLGSKFDGTHVTFDEVPAVLVALYARPDADTGAATSAVRARVSAIGNRRPAPIALKVGYACDLCAGPESR
jgi:multidrug efflux pump